MRALGNIGWRRALAAVAFVLVGCGGIRASKVPLGGKHEVEEAPRRAEVGALPAASATPELTPADEALADTVEVAVESASTNPATPPGEPSKPAAPAAFQARPYAVGQAWTRSFELETNLKVGPDLSLDMRMVSRQEARFEVLAVNAGNIDKLQIAYPVYTTKLSVMGAAQPDTPEDISGKTYVITFSQGKPSVRDKSGNTPTKKELDSVNDDAREPLEIAKALAELSQLTAKGKGDFSAAGALALAGGEDDDTKVTQAKGSLRSLSVVAGSGKSALVDLSYTLVSILDDGGSLEARVAGNLTVLDAPARYQSVTLQGPVELKSADAAGMQGKGTLKVTTTYKY
jgi:hypothetical protein